MKKFKFTYNSGLLARDTKIIEAESKQEARKHFIALFGLSEILKIEELE